MVPEERRFLDQVDHGAPVALRSDLEADLPGRHGRARPRALLPAGLGGVYGRKQPDCVGFRPRAHTYVLLLALAASFCPRGPRGRGPTGPRPYKPLKGRLWPGAGGRASPDLRIFALADARPACGGLGPRPRDRTPTPGTETL
jgi:hypothetical protein